MKIVCINIDQRVIIFKSLLKAGLAGALLIMKNTVFVITCMQYKWVNDEFKERGNPL